MVASNAPARIEPPVAGLRKRIAAASAAAAAHPSLAAPPATSYTYGAHMAVSAALGLLFMGAGALTLATSPQAGAVGWA